MVFFSVTGETSQPEITVTCLPESGVKPPATVEQQIEAAKRQVAMLRARLERRNVRVSKVADIKEPLPLRRVRRWSFSLRELLQDVAGRDHFAKFLSKEFSGENLKFWLSVQELKALPIRRVSTRAKEIWKEYLAADAPSPINIDAASRELTRQKVESGTADRYCFDQAQAHVYHLMKSDSYSRYLRSEMYKDYLNGSKKKTSVKGIRSIVSFTARKETSTN
ncbi:hypothetical protein B5X24_HaOG208506 [Helicoverpa armigera]|uniref:RGS domain-containing protein n=1 Tax=Helicoverpa armigera TaxID=29058 RepID=A0A2W1BJW2_HELAM|nr:hypothetical protein B5X24_HaOG208506 [Helicoverpa armigera]